MNSDWVTLAVLGKPHGNKGELTARSLSDKPDRFQRLKTVYLLGETFDVESIWDHGGTLIFKFRGVDSITDAEKLRGAEVQVPMSQRVELEAGEYFQSDLIGCEVRDHATDRLIGRITDWEECGGPGLLSIDNGRILIPFVKAICRDIRPDDRLIRVDLPEGLEGL